MACKCLEQMQEQLKEQGVAITTETLLNFSTGKMRASPPSLRVHKLNSKSRTPAPVVFCAHCPCCGKKYEPQRSAKPAKKARSK